MNTNNIRVEKTTEEDKVQPRVLYKIIMPKDLWNKFRDIATDSDTNKKNHWDPTIDLIYNNLAEVSEIQRFLLSYQIDAAWVRPYNRPPTASLEKLMLWIVTPPAMQYKESGDKPRIIADKGFLLVWE